MMRWASLWRIGFMAEAMAGSFGAQYGPIEILVALFLEEFV